MNAARDDRAAETGDVKATHGSPWSAKATGAASHYFMRAKQRCHVPHVRLRMQGLAALTVVPFILALGQPSLAAARCTEEQARLREIKRAHVQLLREHFDAARSALQEARRTRVQAQMDRMAAEFAAKVDGAKTESERWPLRSAHLAERDAWLTEERATYWERVRVLNEEAADARTSITLWYQEAIWSLRTAEDCAVAFRRARGERPDGPRSEDGLGTPIGAQRPVDPSIDAFGKETPMEQAVREFEAIEALQSEIEQTETTLEGRIDFRQRLRDDLGTWQRQMADLSGETGLEDAWQGFSDWFTEWVDERTPQLQLPAPEDIERWPDLERLGDPRRPTDLANRLGKVKDGLVDRVGETLLTEMTELLGDAFREGLQQVIDNATLDEKVDLIEATQRVRQHLEDLNTLIEADEQKLDELRERLDAYHRRGVTSQLSARP